MDNAIIKAQLEKDRAGVIEAEKLARKQLAEAEAHIEKMKICIFQLQGQKTAYDRVLASESFFEEKTENKAEEVVNAKA